MAAVLSLLIVVTLGLLVPRVATVALTMTADVPGPRQARLTLVLASAAARLVPLGDGVTVMIDDEVSLREESVRSRTLGFGGKHCIHPRQVPLVNAALSPSSEEVEWASSVIAALDQAGKGGAVVTLDGAMIDKPVIIRARRILESFDHVEQDLCT